MTMRPGIGIEDLCPGPVHLEAERVRDRASRRYPRQRA